MPVDPQTITSIVLRDRARLLAYIGAIVRDHHIAEDVLQEVSMLAMEKHETIKDADTLIPWLRVAARYRALKAVEKRSKRPVLMDAELLALLLAGWPHRRIARSIRHTRISIKKSVANSVATL